MHTPILCGASAVASSDDDVEQGILPLTWCVRGESGVAYIYDLRALIHVASHMMAVAALYRGKHTSGRPCTRIPCRICPTLPAPSTIHSRLATRINIDLDRRQQLHRLLQP